MDWILGKTGTGHRFSTVHHNRFIRHLPDRDTPIPIHHFVRYAMFWYTTADFRRHVPDFVDGLTPVRRKIVYELIKLPKPNPESQIIPKYHSYFASDPHSEHGPEALAQAVIRIAQGMNALKLFNYSTVGEKKRNTYYNQLDNYVKREVQPRYVYIYPNKDIIDTLFPSKLSDEAAKSNAHCFLEDETGINPWANKDTTMPTRLYPVIPIIFTYDVNAKCETMTFASKGQSVEDVIETLRGELAQQEDYKRPDWLSNTFHEGAALTNADHNPLDFTNKKEIMDDYIARVEELYRQIYQKNDTWLKMWLADITKFEEAFKNYQNNQATYEEYVQESSPYRASD